VRLRYAPRALADIDEIFNYISRHSVSGATAVVRQIRAATELLARYPGLGRETSRPDVRVFPIARYPFLVYHRVGTNELVIIHVRHARRALPGEADL
jgi:plasmid stabilization system protein ParE